MSQSMLDSRGNVAGHRTGVRKAPRRVVIGLGGSAFAAKAAAQFWALGWDVTSTTTGEDARGEAVRRKAHALVLAVDPEDLLAAAKLATGLPRKTKVILVGNAGCERLGFLAAGVGAAGMVAETEGVASLVCAVVAAQPTTGN